MKVCINCICEGDIRGRFVSNNKIYVFTSWTGELKFLINSLLYMY